MLEWSAQDLVASWTLVGNKTGATRLGFAVLLKFFEIAARFPSVAGEVPPVRGGVLGRAPARHRGRISRRPLLRRPLGRRPAAVATLTEQEQEYFPPTWREIRHHLGLIHGTISHLVTRSQFLGGLPDAQEGLAEIGFVTTHPTYQGRGVATALMQHLLALPGYEEYVLRDIKDTNTPALKLYAKLGFTEYERRSVRFARRAGFSTYVSLRLMQTT